MSKSKLAEAAHEGKLEQVKALLADGAPLDGSDGELYQDTTAGFLTGAPYHTPLGEAARAGQLAVVEALVAAGAGPDVRNYRNETPLILAVAADRLEVVQWLLAHGANAHLVGSLGNALAALALSLSTDERMPEIAELLLAAGVSPCVLSAYQETAIDVLLRSLPWQGKPNAYAGVALRLGRLFEPRAGEQAAVLTKELDALAALLDKGRQKGARAQASLDKLGSAAEVAKPGWAKRVQRLIGPLEKETNRTAVEQLCVRVLSTPAAVAHAQWPELVRQVIARSWTYGDATEAAYGERLELDALEADEGSALDFYADEHLYTFDWVLALLATPAAVDHPGWEELLLHLCAAKKKAISTMSFGDDEVAALLAAPHVQRHPGFARAVSAARAAFPYASCFGADSALGG